jgi:hypothetical protein
LKNPSHGFFHGGTQKARFRGATIRKPSRAKEWRHMPLPSGLLEFFKVALSSHDAAAI